MDETQPKPFVFVLMPFDKEFNDIYQVGIKQACKDAGTYCERVDEQIFEESILQRIYNQISKADIIVADMSNRNPNVYYETGYAHALGKRVILLTQKAEDIPFDLKHYPHIVYGEQIAELKNQLEKKLNWCVENPKDSLSRVDFQIELFIVGVQLQADPEIEYGLRGSYSDELSLKVDIYNPSNSVYQQGSFKLGVITSELFPKSEHSEKVVELPDRKFIHFFQGIGSIFPHAWESVHIVLEAYDSYEAGVIYPMVIRVFTELGTYDFPFKTKTFRQ